MRRRRLRSQLSVNPIAKVAVRYAVALLLVAATAIVAEVFYRLTGSSRLSTIFLSGVVLSAFALGSGPAYLASGAAFLAYMFLVDPRYQFAFGSAEDFNTLLLFLAAAVLTGALTGRVRDEAVRARQRAEITDALLTATREFSGASQESFIRERLAEQLGVAAKGEAFVREGLRVFSADPAFALSPALVRDAMATEKAGRSGRNETVSSGDWRLRPLQVQGDCFGVAAWRSQVIQADSPDERLIEVLVDVGAAAIVRARLAAAKAEVEARARTEDLRNALLSSVSHDLRTPLSAIMASASSLATFGEAFDAATRRDLATTIQGEAERLDAFVANLLSMTRLEAGALTAQRIGFSVQEVIDRAVRRWVASSERRVAMSVEPGIAEVLGDPQLFEQALGNVIENAVRYTPADREITIEAFASRGLVSVQVRDRGHGVPPGDLPRIFEKFFRSDVTAHKPGTGLGLSIARGLMQGMGGEISARAGENAAGDGPGLVVELRLPVAG